MQTSNSASLPHSAAPNSGPPFHMPVVVRRSLQGVVLGLLLLNALLLVLPGPRGASLNFSPATLPGSGSRTVLRTVTDEREQIALTVDSDWENVTPPFQQAILTLRNRRHDLGILAYTAGTPDAGQTLPPLADYNALAIQVLLNTTPKSAWVRSKTVRIGPYAAMENEFTLAAEDGPFFMLQTVIETPTTFYQLQSMGHAESAEVKKRVLHEVIRTFRATNVPPTSSQESP